MTVLSEYLQQIHVSESTSDFSIVDDIEEIVSPPSPSKAKETNRLAYRLDSPLSIPKEFFPPVVTVQELISESHKCFGQVSELGIEKLRTNHRLKVVQVSY